MSADDAVTPGVRAPDSRGVPSNEWSKSAPKPVDPAGPPPAPRNRPVTYSE